MLKNQQGMLNKFELGTMNDIRAANAKWEAKAVELSIPEIQASAAFWSKFSEDFGITGKALLFIKSLVK